MPKNIISLEGINENNLKNIELEFTLNEITTITGKSGAGADASTVGTGVQDLKVIGVVDEPGNAVGDAFTKIEVMLNLNEDNFRQVYVTAPVTATAGN